MLCFADIVSAFVEAFIPSQCSANDFENTPSVWCMSYFGFSAGRARPLHAIEYRCYPSGHCGRFFTELPALCRILPHACGLVSYRTQDAHPLAFVGIIQLHQRRGRHVYPSANARRQLSLHPGAFWYRGGDPLEEKYWRLPPLFGRCTMQSCMITRVRVLIQPPPEPLK